MPYWVRIKDTKTILAGPFDTEPEAQNHSNSVAIVRDAYEVVDTAAGHEVLPEPKGTDVASNPAMSLTDQVAAQRAARETLKESLQEGLDALAGDSNDAEHSALYSMVECAQALLESYNEWTEVEIRGPYDEDDEQSGGHDD